ncbi:glycoside hydrolase family 18 protein [Chitinibacter tainanensis]|uniref:glycoside hydrolase family 18 protein n=1 Tax=Chitinibacter tainanensis TaxID=230667 RepID=UPI0004136BF7|nr:glycoside hydrolase family 18 protein [Chitinibacter tainanensis]
MRTLISVIAGSLVLAGCATPEPKAENTYPELQKTNAVVQDHGKQVVSYIRTWPLGSTVKDMDAGVYWRADQIRCELLTTLNISFAQIRDGEAYIKELEVQPNSDKSGTVPPFTNLWQEVAKVQQKCPHLKTNLSIGGWGAEGFSDLSKTPESRAKFIASVLKMVEANQLTGVDIDWEYPVGPDWGVPIKTSADDRENYPALLEDIRAALDKLATKTGKKYQVSVAVPASPWFVQKNNIRRIENAVDYLKVMAYDYYGTWSKTTGHNSNLYRNPSDPAWGGWGSDQGMQVYLNAGVKPQKLLLGLAYYGRGWKGVSNSNSGLFQKFTGAAYEDGVTYTDIQTKFLTNPAYKRYWDETAKAPWLYNGDVFISYEDQEGLKYKADYAKKHELGGVMIWEYAHDMNGELLQATNNFLR